MYKSNEKEMWGVPTGTPRSPTYIRALYWLWLQSGLCLTLILRLPIARVNFGRWIKVGLDMIRHLIRDHRTSQSAPWLRGLRRGVNKTLSRSPATHNSTATTTAAKYSDNHCREIHRRDGLLMLTSQEGNRIKIQKILRFGGIRHRTTYASAVPQSSDSLRNSTER